VILFRLWNEVTIVTTWDKEGGGKDCETPISSSNGGGGLAKGWLSMSGIQGDEGLKPKGCLSLN